MLKMLLLFLVLATSAPALASDGLIEINQTCAVNTGCLAGDTPGLPVTINQSGSYQLTGNLTLPDINTDGIIATAGFVQIDLNGFTIAGPGSCNFIACSTGTGRGIAQSPFITEVIVQNGFVRGVGSDGVQLNSGQIEGVTIASVGGNGITLEDGLVRGNRIGGVGGVGLRFTSDHVSFSDNWIGLTGAASSGPAILGGRDAGGNTCTDDSCKPRGMLRYYLATGPTPGNQALTSCAADYHMASIFEIADPSNLLYDTGLGFVAPDSGLGPPNISASTVTIAGWVRTGTRSLASGEGGVANCSTWTTGNGLSRGTAAALVSNGEGSTSRSSDPWFVFDVECDGAPEFTEIGVWCIQD